MKKAVFTLLYILTLAVSCNDKRVYDHFQHAPVAGWEKNDTLFFDIPKVAESGHYSADLGLRINATYPFMGLTLIVEQFSYPDRKRRVDTVNCKLMDSNGKMKGYGIGSFQYTFHITDLDLQQGDSLHIGVRHDMKREILPGISDIGIILKKE
ncbi:MAG: gliding motility lipoprotein GldH [Prevotella buccae]|uniref:gliding motility lipoprotein GldH n=1 Tax=Segatella buccae TaxID=28126 RepID=UPI00242C9533|nr:gliding motility lipoprotein GldH [Segatella buccae]MBS5895753.1 gliding motility lipoprotein GldH [Segatella buccae]